MRLTLCPVDLSFLSILSINASLPEAATSSCAGGKSARGGWGGGGVHLMDQMTRWEPGLRNHPAPKVKSSALLTRCHDWPNVDSVLMTVHEVAATNYTMWSLGGADP